MDHIEREFHEIGERLRLRKEELMRKA